LSDLGGSKLLLDDSFTVPEDADATKELGVPDDSGADS
jgi:hypothetical protein